MDKVYYFLEGAETYYLATVEAIADPNAETEYLDDPGNVKLQPRVRPFGTLLLYDGRLYIQTGKVKDVSKQIAENPLVELCAFMDGKWLRISGELVNDDSVDIKRAMLEKMPSLKAMYSAEDSNMQMLYFKNATATFSSFTEEPEVIEFGWTE
ncbi:MAG: NimC/NimA family protein [Lachnospiraceae bacterium]|nr:NimC/NimA family protein [Lachnospiraceae bacterium]